LTNKQDTSKHEGQMPDPGKQLQVHNRANKNRHDYETKNPGFLMIIHGKPGIQFTG